MDDSGDIILPLIPNFNIDVVPAYQKLESVISVEPYVYVPEMI
jgi:hypothetical protein